VMTSTPLYLCFEHDPRANALRVCREGKPVRIMLYTTEL